LAIHVPVGETLEQVTEYVGDKPKPGRIGRRFPANAGIIGKAFREKEVFVGRRINDDYEAYVREMVREWNYTEERARHLEPGVMEWMAVPFIEGDRLNAILYVDATQRGFFTQDRQELVLAAQRGIAVFVGKRYA
jgi:putative methionine-R-sulfoxide reductase with GAF domain